MITKDRIQKLVESQLVDADLFIVDIDVQSGNKILVYLDSDTSVAISDCVTISRFVEKSLDRDVEDFELEVSSAGFMPLKLKRQYVKNVGRTLKVTLKEGDKVTGELVKVEEDAIVLSVAKGKKDSEEKLIAFEDIKKAIVEPSFKKRNK